MNVRKVPSERLCRIKKKISANYDFFPPLTQDVDNYNSYGYVTVLI